MHTNEIAEYNNNLNLINELESLRSKVKSLIVSINECSNNVTLTYKQVTEAIINDQISISLNKINDYAKDLDSIKQSLSNGINDINSKINDIQAKNRYLLGIIYG